MREARQKKKIVNGHCWEDIERRKGLSPKQKQTPKVTNEAISCSVIGKKKFSLHALRVHFNEGPSKRWCSTTREQLDRRLNFLISLDCDGKKYHHLLTKTRSGRVLEFFFIHKKRRRLLVREREPAGHLFCFFLSCAGCVIGAGCGETGSNRYQRTSRIQIALPGRSQRISSSCYVIPH